MNALSHFDPFEAPDVPVPDANGCFKTPAEGAKFMASMGVPQTILNGKIPLKKNWQNEATTDFTQIDLWAAEYPGCNFGSVMKAEVGGYYAIETDSPAPRTAFKDETQKDFSARLVIKSGPGRAHWYYKHDAESLAALANIGQTSADGFSLRLHNEQCVSPGGYHPERKTQYAIVSRGPPTTATAQEINWLKIKKNDTAKKLTMANPNDPIPEHHRNVTLTSIGGALREKGLVYEEILAVLTRKNEECCTPPLDQSEIETISRSVSRYPIGNPNVVLHGGIPAGSQPDVISSKSSAEPNSRTEVTPLVSVDGDKFMVEIIPPRKVLLQTITKHEPVFFEQSINQIFAWRGTGKTNVGLGLTMAFATAGSFLNWEAPHRSRVLYVEGEMPESQLQERWNFIVGKTNGYARLITVDKQPLHMLPSLATQLGMDKVEATLAALAAEGFKVDVLMLDSISTLFNVKANDEETWITIQAWLMNLRSRGYCIFFFHHSGKGGLSRSHSKSEDMLDVSIKLESPKEKEGGCLHAIMTYDKVRAGLDEPSAEIKMRRSHSDVCLCRKAKGMAIGCRGDSVVWEYRETTDALLAKAFQMFDDSASLSEVAKELKVARSTAQYWKNKWEEKGKSEPDAIL